MSSLIKTAENCVISLNDIMDEKKNEHNENNDNKNSDNINGETIEGYDIVNSCDQEQHHLANAHVAENKIDTETFNTTDEKVKDVTLSSPLPPPPPSTPILETNTVTKCNESPQNEGPLQQQELSPSSKTSNRNTDDQRGRLYASNSLPFLDAINLKKILSTRPSTPYTHAVSYSNRCFDSKNSNVKNDLYRSRVTTRRNTYGDMDKQKHNFACPSQSLLTLPTTFCRANKDKIRSQSKLGTNTSCDILQYSRANLLSIGKTLKQLHNYGHFRGNRKLMLNCEQIELEARLKRFYIWRNPHVFAYPNLRVKYSKNLEVTKKFYTNEIVSDVPLKSQIIDESIIRSKPPQQPIHIRNAAVAGKQQQFGSGRCRNSSRKSQNCSPRANIRNYETNIGDEATSGNLKRHSRLDQFKETNYVRRVMSSYLVVSHKNQNHHEEETDEKPEWFSCGPTSRLDTIELTGFDDDDNEDDGVRGNTTDYQTDDDVVMNKSDNNKDEPVIDTNNVQYDSNNNTIISKNNEKNNPDEVKTKNSQFQCIENDNIQQNYIDNSDLNKENNNTIKSKFLPYFGCAKQSTEKIEEQVEQRMHSYASIEDFFKNIAPQTQHQLYNMENGRSPIAPNNIATSGVSNNNMPIDMPSVNDLETQWRQNCSRVEQAQSNDNNCINNTIKMERDAENFRNLIKQLNINSNNNYQVPNLGFQFNNVNASILHHQQHPLQMQQRPLIEFVQQHHLQQSHRQERQLPNVFNQHTLNTLFTNEAILLLQQQIQLRNILSRPRSQALIIGLIKGEITRVCLESQLSHPLLPLSEREAINAVLTYITTTQQLQQQQELRQHYQRLNNTENAITPGSLQPNNMNIFSNNNVLTLTQLQSLQNLAKLQQRLARQQQQQQQQQQGQQGQYVLPQQEQQQQQQQYISIPGCSNQGVAPYGVTVAQKSPHVSHEELQTHANWVMQNALMKHRLKEQQTNALNMQKMWQANCTVTLSRNRQAVQQHIEQFAPNNLVNQTKISNHVHFEKIMHKNNNQNDEHRHPISYNNAVSAPSNLTKHPNNHYLPDNQVTKERPAEIDKNNNVGDDSKLSFCQ